MRTILLLGLAAGSLLLAGHAAHAQTPAPRLDYGNPSAPDTRVYTGYPDRIPGEADYRRVEGAYDADGRWTGTWDGTYEAPDGRRYEGRYEGSVEGRPGTGYPPPPYHDPAYSGGYAGGYDPHYDAEMQRRCGRGGGAVGGAVVGGVVGGIAGNVIAGRGNRTEGTLIGGGLGAVAGAAIGDASDKKRCDEWLARRGGGGYYADGYYGHPGATTVYQQGGYGYGYYSPGVVVTTVITTPAVTETVETTTRTYYETVPVKKRYVAKRKAKPKPKPRCVC